MDSTYYLIGLIFSFGIIILVIQWKLQKINKSLTLVVLITILLLEFLIKPQLCIESAINGAKLFFFKVFPSLFSFMILCNLIIYFDGIKIYSKVLGHLLCKPMRLPKECSLVLVISALCGYPLGAKYSCQLYEEGIIDFNTCKRLLNIASNSSPLFIVGSVGISMMNNLPIAYILLVSNYLSCFFMALIIKPQNKSSIQNSKKINNRQIHHSSLNLGEILKKSIDNSINSCFSIFGSIVIFTVLLDILRSTYLFQLLVYNSYIETFIIGLIEMTNGCHLVSISSYIMPIKIIFLSFFITFSGLCVVTQVYAFTYKHEFSMITYIKNKLIQAFAASIFSVITYKIVFNNISIAAFSNSLETYYLSITSLFVICSLILVLPFIFSLLTKLFDFS